MFTNIQITATDKAENCTNHQFSTGERIKAAHKFTAQLKLDGRNVHKYLCPKCAASYQETK